jgi:hypothetical protein
MVSQWILHIKDYAQRHNLSYGCALSKPECRAEYREKYPKPLTKKQQKEKAEAEAEAKARAEAEAEAKAKAEAEAEAKAKQSKRGRKPKYATEEEKYKAKLESNKLKRREQAEIAKKTKSLVEKAKEIPNIDLIRKEVESLPVIPTKKQEEHKTFIKIMENPAIDEAVEEAIKDMYYESFPKFMKGSTYTRERVYKDKFLTISKKDQDNIRKKVKAKLMAQLFKK